MFAEDEARLLVAEAGSAAELDALVARRVAGEPLEHVLGWAEFAGLRIAVTAGVFVPRRRTEVLVEPRSRWPGRVRSSSTSAVGPGRSASPSPRRGGVELHAADVDPAAVTCARTNVARVGGHVHSGDLFDALPTTLRGRVDVLVANVPYVPTGGDRAHAAGGPAARGQGRPRRRRRTASTSPAG